MRIVVLGGGYAGVVAVRKLERLLPSDVELTLIDESASHLVQHELHRLVRNPNLVDWITVDFESLLSSATFVRGRVTELDADAGVVALADGTDVEFDYAVIALGARTAYYDLPGVEEHSTPLKTVTDAEAIRERLTGLLESGSGRVVIGGAGLSGVQIAGEIAAVVSDSGLEESVEVLLLEQAETVAPGFPSHFSDAVYETLIEAGVSVETNATVTGATADAVELESDTIDYEQFIWTGGIRAPAPVGGDRPTVPATLRWGDRTFMAGDVATVIDRDGDRLPATSQSAMAQATVAARNVARLVEYERTGGRFEPRLATVDFEATGWIVSIGERTVAQVGPLVFHDTAALAMKAAVGARWLTGVGSVRKAAGLVGDELLAPRRGRR